MAVCKGKQKLNEAPFKPTDRGRVCAGRVMLYGYNKERAVEWQSHAKTVCGYWIVLLALSYSENRRNQLKSPVSARMRSTCTYYACAYIIDPAYKQNGTTSPSFNVAALITPWLVSIAVHICNSCSCRQDRPQEQRKCQPSCASLGRTLHYSETKRRG